MSKEKRDFSDIEYRFSFALTINDSENKNNDIIICKRDFNINNIDEQSLYSLELKETIDDIVNLIDRDLKSKSRVYVWYNFDENYDNPEFTTPIQKESQTNFKFTLYDQGKVVIEKIWSGDGYPFSVRNSVDLTNKKYKYDNWKTYEMDFSKQIAQKAAADRPDLTSIIMRHISSTCASFQGKGKTKLMYKQHIPELKLEQVVFNNEKGCDFVNNRSTPIKYTVDDNGFNRAVYSVYTTEYTCGDKKYSLSPIEDEID